MTSFGKGLAEAARQAQSIARGEADAATYRVHVQAEFAQRFGFPIGTLRDLEQGQAQPDSSTRAYLLVIRREPEAVRRALEAA